MDNYLLSPGDTAYVKINMPSLTLSFGGLGIKSFLPNPT